MSNVNYPGFVIYDIQGIGLRVTTYNDATGRNERKDYDIHFITRSV